MLGEKIRRLRLELGLSQQQLAGNDMTRVFISLVESGKCNPSPDTLQVIAQRLGKPVRYFLDTDEADESVAVLIELLDKAAHDIEQADNDSWESALRKLRYILRSTNARLPPEMEAKTRGLLVKCLRRLGRNEEVIVEGEFSLECYKQIGDTKGVARVHMAMGSAAFVDEDFELARSAFAKAVNLMRGLKTLQDEYVECLIGHGSALFRLGLFSQALSTYDEALRAAKSLGIPAVQGTIALGICATVTRMDDQQAAYYWATQAVELMKRSGCRGYPLSIQNLAIVEATRGNWETSYGLLTRCIEMLKAEGRVKEQASAMEELANYWVHKGDLERAEEVCWTAIDLLDHQDDTVLRGRLYRSIGQLAAKQNQPQQALRLLNVSLALLRRLKARDEVEKTTQQLDEIHRTMCVTKP